MKAIWSAVLLMLAPAALAQQAAEQPAGMSRFRFDGFSPAAGDAIRFWSRQDRKYLAPPPAETRLNLLLALPNDGEGRRDRIAAVEVDRKLDCASRTMTSAFTTFAADGHKIGAPKALPRDLARLAPDNDPTVVHWTEHCDPPKPLPEVRPAPRSEPKLDDFPDWTVDDAAAALALARVHVAALAATLKLPAEGRFVVSMVTPARAYLLDTAHSDSRNGQKQFQWLEVTPADLGLYLRQAYKADCETKVGSREFGAQYDKTGGLLWVIGPSPEGSFDQLKYGPMLEMACSLGDRRDAETYATVADGVAEARKLLMRGATVQ